MSRSLSAVRAYWLGRIGYLECWDLQRSLVESVHAGTHPGGLLLLEHPPVFTIGRRGDGTTLLWTEEECARRGVEVVWTDRGGDATYHGPGQLVGYPILHLPRLGSDILSYIRNLERSLVAYMRTLDLAAEPGGRGFTGVWTSGEKVAAIGVKLNHAAVTSHGFALNLTSDLETFNTGIVPCGLVGKRATSVLELSGRRVDVEAAAHDYVPHFVRAVGASVEWGDAADLGALGPAPGRESSSLPPLSIRAR